MAPLRAIPVHPSTHGVLWQSPRASTTPGFTTPSIHDPRLHTPSIHNFRRPPAASTDPRSPGAPTFKGDPAVGSDMSEDCIFCAIADGEIPGEIVYEDDLVVAFLDANPLAEGHTLVIPRDHHETLADLPADVGGAIGAAATEVAPAVEVAVDADATTVAFNNGPAAGQEVPHVHCHVVPRFEGDGYGPIHALFGGQLDLDEAELAAVGEAIRDAQ